MQGAMGEMKGFVREVYTSIQGEGIELGRRQTFIRFSGCNLSCNYCDTPKARKTEGPFIYQGKVYQNPVEVEFLSGMIDAAEIAITGGEPLLQIDFLEILCKTLKEKNLNIYLDTNATLPDDLSKIIDYVDTVCLDFKVPTAAGKPGLWDKHKACLEIAVKKMSFVKMVINENLLPRELETVCSIISEIDESVPLVIQPVFGCNIPDILDIQKKALDFLRDVRVIPQVHKYLNLQ